MPTPTLDYQPPTPNPRILPLNRAALRTAVFGIPVGILWESIAVLLGGGQAAALGRPECLIPGILSGISTTLFTLWTRQRTAGKESLKWILATYYLGILYFGFFFTIAVALLALFQSGANMDQVKGAVGDCVGITVFMLCYGTLPFGPVLLPLCWLTRILVWKIYRSLEKNNPHPQP